MDDAHIFATEDQIFDEVSAILDMMVEFYTKFGFETRNIFASTDRKSLTYLMSKEINGN